MDAFVFTYLAILPSNQTTPLDTMLAELTLMVYACSGAFHTIDWPDIMEPMNTQEAWGFFKTVLQDIIDKFVPLTTGVRKKRTYLATCLLGHSELE